MEQINLMSALQAAEYLDVTRQQIYSLAARGQLGRKIGSFWLFTPDELDEYRKNTKIGRPKKTEQKK